ncbi:MULTISPECIES: glycine betaine/L-proline ABC transporter ATP-binding protein [unclassified Pseudovibrio]|uniref:quaternary amine ABC transporter ATP-binding protein n=1 Tax=unclassified Pseudovibrio TaxID=2627060 RepID=UPI0007AEBAB3|nr:MULTISPECIES: glycine betaine/L-proline ABC transporter ATP-binding protein [unclassified Pseudovibrio]KZL02334.1 Glycine betaine transport ATP-binding protein OpuAA [Pseudovibrio sp. W74]KZL08122.1 Glycine betaine transport ATP-binding protein OpuAA [Pseudovibrio sp. Ad14]
MDQPVLLDCKGLWKIYGANAGTFLQNQDSSPDTSALEQANLTGAVREANLQIMKGEIFVIMGLSGSGKSTLVRCLSRLIEATAGSIHFEGQDLLAMSERELIDVRRKKMGMVFQQFALLPHLTVLQNVAFPLDVQGVHRPEREARAHEMIELVGLNGRETAYPRELSGGQQQRVGIARSLVGDPHLWFLDEPFSALDPLIRREMQNEFLRLQNKLHKTILFITHDFEEAIRLADRIAVMKDGEIVQIATPEQLVSNPATDYVEEFTRHIPRTKVIQLEAIMTAGCPAGTYAGDLSYSLKVADVASEVGKTSRAFRVLDDDGVPVGTIDREKIVSVMLGQELVE